MIVNPILKGFNPDPSIIRVGEDYYLATSTFEWFPGVQIYHSKDLFNWNLISHPLNTADLLDMKGVPDSCGVWAPCLSHDGEYFYLVYSNVKSFDGLWKDTPNYVIRSKDITGPWSKPVYLSSTGFDGSLFHDEDGKKWYLSLLVDHRANKFFGGIVMQEYDAEEGRLIGPDYHIFEGSELGITEGPHLYKIEDHYYLITAEGGTEYGHAVSVARSKEITGPYELHPANPLISSRNDPDHSIQKTGHGDLVWNEDGDCFLVYLCGRPLEKLGRCILGRETAIDQIVWKEGWPYLKNGTSLASESFEYNGISVEGSTIHEIVDLRSSELPLTYQSLRISQDESWIKYENALLLKGRDSLSSCFEQSLVARRVQSLRFEYSCSLEYSAESFQQMAGLVVYYNTGHHYYLHLMGDESDNILLSLLRHDNYTCEELLENYVSIEKGSTVFLRCKMIRSELSFYYSTDNDSWIELGSAYDSSILSDDYVRESGHQYRPAFTGCLVGIATQDLKSRSTWAKFNTLEYKEL